MRNRVEISRLWYSLVLFMAGPTALDTTDRHVRALAIDHSLALAWDIAGIVLNIVVFAFLTILAFYHVGGWLRWLLSDIRKNWNEV